MQRQQRFGHDSAGALNRQLLGSVRVSQSEREREREKKKKKKRKREIKKTPT
jgi:hypothetical protein